MTWMEISGYDRAQFKKASCQSAATGTGTWTQGSCVTERLLEHTVCNVIA